MKKLTLLAGLLIIYFLTGQMIFGQTKSFEKFKYISPKPGSKFINPENSIVFRHGDVLDESSVKNSLISVTGSLSGEISGIIKLSKDARTIIFYPEKPYQYKESINVNLQPGLATKSGLSMEGVSFSFIVAEEDNKDLSKVFDKDEFEIENVTNVKSSPYQSTVNQYLKGTDDYPDNMPLPLVVEFDNPAPGYAFATPAGGDYGTFFYMFDSYGTPVFYREWPTNCNNFSLNWNGQFKHVSKTPTSCYFILDEDFNIVDTAMMQNGYGTNGHDMVILQNGNYLLMQYDAQLVNMDTVVPGGDTAATVKGFIIQEIDIDNNVILQWRSWDHFEITDAVGEDFLSDNIDYVHGNSLEEDLEGNLFMSCRSMEEITKIDRITGEIIWRFGPLSKNNEFTFTNDTVGFSHQHDARQLPNGNITLYDNGNYHDPNFSQSLEYEIDEENLTATLVWSYQRDPAVYSMSRGSTIRLENGNTMIGWGNLNVPGASEVTPEGVMTWEVIYPAKTKTYRTPKWDWITDIFEPNITSHDFGTYDDYVPWPKIFVITNNRDYDVDITSAHNHTTSYNVVTQLPLTIPAGGTANLTVNFSPTQQGQIDDVLTLRSESMFADTLPQMIARQIFLTGYVVDENPPQASISPADGSIDISLSSQVKITFDESIVKADGNTLKTSYIPNIIEFKKNDATGDPVEYSAYIDAWKRQIIITPELESKQQYFVKLIGNTVADGDGNILTSAVTSTFNTTDVEAPVAIFFPEDSAVDMKRNIIVTLSFDEKIYKVGGDEIMDEDLPEMLLYKENDTLGTDVSYTATINADKTEVYIMSDEDLDEYQQYYSVLYGNMIQDEAGNIIEAYQAITFTTGEEFGVGENILENQYRIFPNPNNGLLSIQFRNQDAKNILIYNIEGSLVYSTDQIKQEIYEIDIQDLPAGIYVIKVNNLINNSVVEMKTLKH